MIRLKELLDCRRIVILSETDKRAVLDAMVDLLGREPQVHDVEGLRRAIHDRESIMSTGVGFGIAVPHAKVDDVDDLVLAIGISADGVEIGRAHV